MAWQTPLQAAGGPDEAGVSGSLAGVEAHRASGAKAPKNWTQEGVRRLRLENELATCCWLA